MSSPVSFVKILENSPRDSGPTCHLLSFSVAGLTMSSGNLLPGRMLIYYFPFES